MPTEALVVAAPLAVEAWAVRRGLGEAHAVVRTGMGRARSGRAVSRLRRHRARALAVAGLAGAVAPGLRPGDVVVAAEVTGPGGTVRCPGAPLLARALAARGLTVHCGPVHSVDRIVHGDARRRMAADGALVVDMESDVLETAAQGRAFAVVRSIVDTPGCPLARPGTLVRGIGALRSLGIAATALRQWAVAVRPRTVTITRGLPGASGHSDVVLVAGGRSTHRLPAMPERPTGRAVYHVGDVRNIELPWLVQARTVEINTDRSSRQPLVTEIVEVLRALGPVEVNDTARMSQLTLPKEVGP